MKLTAPSAIPGIWHERDPQSGIVGLSGLVRLDIPATTPGMVVVAKANEPWETCPELRWQVWPDSLEIEILDQK